MCTFVDIYPKAYDMLLKQIDENTVGWLTMIGLVAGMIVMAISLQLL